MLDAEVDRTLYQYRSCLNHELTGQKTVRGCRPPAAARTRLEDGEFLGSHSIVRRSAS
jgi:hypothetical protein